MRFHPRVIKYAQNKPRLNQPYDSVLMVVLVVTDFSVAAFFAQADFKYTFKCTQYSLHVTTE